MLPRKHHVYHFHGRSRRGKNHGRQASGTRAWAGGSTKGMNSILQAILKRCVEASHSTDTDRRSWLDALRAVIQAALENNENGILACSALKRHYRARLRVNEDVVFVQLAATPDVIRRRLEHSKGHFMNPSLLENQLVTLETPQSALSLDASLPPAVLVQQVERALHI